MKEEGYRCAIFLHGMRIFVIFGLASGEEATLTQVEIEAFQTTVPEIQAWKENVNVSDFLRLIMFSLIFLKKMCCSDGPKGNIARLCGIWLLFCLISKQNKSESNSMENKTRVYYLGLVVADTIKAP